MNEEAISVLRNQRDQQNGLVAVYVMPDSIYTRAGKIIFTYSKAALGVVFGSFYLQECPAEEKIPIAVIVCFCIMLLTYIMNLPQDMRYILNLENSGKSVFLKCLDTVLHLILIGVFFAECYWIYSIQPDTEDIGAKKYCNFIFYHVVYWGTTLMLIVTAISIPMYIAIYFLIDS